MGQAPRSDGRKQYWTVLPADMAGAAVVRLNDIVMVTEADPFEEPGPRILYVNPAFERITGYTADEVLGRSPRFLQGPLTPESEIRRIEEALLARRPVRAELLNYRKDGTPFWVEFEASSMKSPSADAEFFVFIEREVTERKQTEEALRGHEQAMATLFRNLPGMAYRCRDDDHWTKEFVSAGCCDLTGYKPEDLIDNRLTSFGEIIHPDDRKAVRDTVSAAAASDGQFELSYRIRTRDGAIKWVLDRGRAVAVPNSSTRAFEGFISDVTERKLLEQQVVQNQRLESIGTLAGGIAHDLNNILAPIMMAGDLLQEKMPDAEGGQLLGVIKGNAKRGAELVRQILLFARGMEGPRVSVQPQALLGEIRTFLDGTFPKSVHIDCAVAPGTGPILGDPSQLHQLLLNLCVNARDAMPSGGRLSLSAAGATVSPTSPRPHPEAVPGDFIRLDVADTGTGIPDILKGQIFDPFFTTKGVGRGSGLGLSTARSIVKAHAGFITFVSREGAGTTFSVFLPAADAAAQQRAPAEASPRPGLPPRGKGERILIVDDEDSVRQIMRTSLEHFGFQATKAGGGAEALEIARSSPGVFSLAIVDIQMPGLDGIQTIAALRLMNPDLPVVASSGYASVENRDNAAANGVHHFLEKPFTVETLVRTVHAAMGRPAA
jgi:PAS domain S-box-containing protein